MYHSRLYRLTLGFTFLIAMASTPSAKAEVLYRKVHLFQNFYGDLKYATDAAPPGYSDLGADFAASPISYFPFDIPIYDCLVSRGALFQHFVFPYWPAAGYSYCAGYSVAVPRSIATPLFYAARPYTSYTNYLFLYVKSAAASNFVDGLTYGYAPLGHGGFKLSAWAFPPAFGYDFIYKHW